MLKIEEWSSSSYITLLLGVHGRPVSNLFKRVNLKALPLPRGNPHRRFFDLFCNNYKKFYLIIICIVLVYDVGFIEYLHVRRRMRVSAKNKYARDVALVGSPPNL